MTSRTKSTPYQSLKLTLMTKSFFVKKILEGVYLNDILNVNGKKIYINLLPTLGRCPIIGVDGLYNKQTLYKIKIKNLAEK